MIDGEWPLLREAKFFRSCGWSDEVIARWLDVPPHDVGPLVEEAGEFEVEYLPTPAEIAEGAARIRANWTEEEWRVRAGASRPDRWTPPFVVVEMGDAA